MSDYCQLCFTYLTRSPQIGNDLLLIWPLKTPILRGADHSHFTMVDEFNSTGLLAWRNFSWVNIASNRPLASASHRGCQHGMHLPCMLKNLEQVFNSSQRNADRDYTVCCQRCGASCKWFFEMETHTESEYILDDFVVAKIPTNGDKFGPTEYTREGFAKMYQRPVVRRLRDELYPPTSPPNIFYSPPASSSLLAPGIRLWNNEVFAGSFNRSGSTSSVSSSSYTNFAAQQNMDVGVVIDEMVRDMEDQNRNRAYLDRQGPPSVEIVAEINFDVPTMSPDSLEELEQHLNGQ